MRPECISLERLQPGFDLGAARLQERRQREFFAERCHRLVGGESGAVGGDLEQDAVRFAEIKTAKIKPVDLAGVADAKLAQPARPAMVLLLVRSAERDVMHAAGALPRLRQI